MTSSDGSAWFSDPGTLLREVQRTGAHWAHVPEIPGYADLVEIGRGGQGVVYRACQSSTSRTVAIKVLLDGTFASDASRLRFEREIDLAASLRHAGIVRLYDSGVTGDGRVFCVMEFTDGVPVDHPSLELVGDVPRTAALVARICDAIQHAHQHGVIHRDLKPANILVGEDDAPQILDFGLAKTVSGDFDGSLPATVSRTGQFLGSLAWASPEQIDASPGGVDVRTDVYSLGVMLYQLTTGSLPHDLSGNLRDVIERISESAPPRPRSLRPDIPDDVEAITLRCLAREPERRYQSAGDLACDLRRYLAGDVIEAKRTVAWYRMQKAVRRYRYTFAMAVLAIVIFVAFGATMSVLYRRASRAESIADVRLTDARRQARRAEIVTGYLRGTLLSVDPTRVGGGDVTVREMLDGAGGRLAAELGREPLAHAQVASTLGSVYFNLGRFDEAEQMGSAAERIYRGQVRRRDMDEAGIDEARNQLAHSVKLLAKVNDAKGRLDLAEKQYEEAIALWEQAHHGGHGEVLWAMIDLASLRKELGRFRAAEALLGEVLEQARTPRAGAAPIIATAGYLRGQIQAYLGDHERGERHLRDALGHLERLYGASSVQVADGRIALAGMLIETDRAAEALDLATAALESSRALLGRENRRVANCLGTVANARAALGETAEAEAQYIEAIGILRAVLGEEHNHVGFMLGRYGTLLANLRRDAEAEPVLRDALRIYRSTLPADHSGTAIIGGNLGCLLVRRGALDDAEPLLRTALAARTRLFGAEVAEASDDAACLSELLSRSQP